MRKKITGQLAVEVAELYPPQGQGIEADNFALPDTNRNQLPEEGGVSPELGIGKCQRLFLWK